MSAPCLPAEMPDLRLTLLDKWSTPVWQNVALNASIRGEMFTYGRQIDRRAAEEKAANYIRWERQLLQNADLYWVGDEMCDLLYHARQTIPDDVMISNLTIPADSGFVVFEKPWRGLDAYGHQDPDGVVQLANTEPGDTMDIDAIGWAWSHLPPNDDHPDGFMALSISMYVCHAFEEGLHGKELQWATMTGAIADGMSGRLGPIGEGNVGWLLAGTAWSPAGRSDWPLHSTLGAGSPHEPDAYRRSAREDRQLIAALFTLLTAHVADVREQHPDRATRRRTERRHAKPGAVKLVYLRRPDRDADDDDDHAGRKVEWSHRWMVSAHMRLQACGPGRRERRLTLIAPHVKGPAEKELVVKESVRVWIR